MSQTIWFTEAELRIGDKLDPTEWVFAIDAPLPDGSTHALAIAIVPVTNAVPSGPMDLVLNKKTISGDRVQLRRNTRRPMRGVRSTAWSRISLTDLALDRAIEYFRNRFGREPEALGGSLIDENKKHFQIEYLEAIDRGTREEEAPLEAVKNVSFGRARIDRGYELTVTVSDIDIVQHGADQRRRAVPRRIHVLAKRIQ